MSSNVRPKATEPGREPAHSFTRHLKSTSSVRARLRQSLVDHSVLITLFSAMKFWQLISAFRLDAPELELVLAADEWAEFAVWYREFNVTVANGDRGKLDTVVPKTLVRDVAARSSQMFCLSQGVLRHLQNESQGKVLTASEVVERFGGAVIEDVNEFGSANVRDLPSTTD